MLKLKRSSMTLRSILLSPFSFLHYRNQYKKEAQILYHSKMLAAHAGKGDYPKVRTFLPLETSTNSVFADMKEAEKWAGMQGKVDIGELTWEQRERVLRLLFAKLNGLKSERYVAICIINSSNNPRGIIVRTIHGLGLGGLFEEGFIKRSFQLRSDGGRAETWLYHCRDSVAKVSVLMKIALPWLLLFFYHASSNVRVHFGLTFTAVTMLLP